MTDEVGARERATRSPSPVGPSTSRFKHTHVGSGSASGFMAQTDQGQPAKKQNKIPSKWNKWNYSLDGSCVHDEAPSENTTKPSCRVCRRQEVSGRSAGMLALLRSSSPGLASSAVPLRVKMSSSVPPKHRGNAGEVSSQTNAHFEY